MTDVVQIDVTKLTPLSHEVISKQATINIGKLVNTCRALFFRDALTEKFFLFIRYHWSRSSR
jgi:hypothetical protein